MSTLMFRGSGKDFSCLWSICASQLRRVETPGPVRSGRAGTAVKERTSFHRSRNRSTSESLELLRHSLLVRRGESCPVLRRVPQQHPQGEAFPEHRPSKHFTQITTIGKATPHLRQSQSYNDLHRGENGFESFWSSLET